MKIYMLMLIFMFMVGVMKFTFNRKYLLLSLLILEYKVLIMFLLLYFCLNFCMFENYLCNAYIVFTVCEGVLGLSILVSMVRMHGNDYFSSFNMMQC
uniref:NADH dehydrogenase subunit 4L n=1 Tax=Pulex irritans TaxID=173820 RepID=UPI002028B0AB|nr:NADH dehydrogenase subunit 4L [Pulex irritans]UPV72704.1 NADH dehydrogenase subunit 4L [Pulex irritans]